MKSIKSILLSVFLGSLWSCYNSSEDLSVEDLDLVATAYDEAFNFDDAVTFVLPDSVVRITGDGSGGTTNDGQFDDQILERVRQNLLDLGYTEEPDPENIPSDLVVTVQVLEVNNYVVTNPYFFWDYWGWYPWFPGYGYGPGYGWYYPYPVVVDTYSTGTLLINIFDPEQNGTETETIPMVWLGAVNGLLEGSTTSLQNRIDRGIDQAFDQSPYLTQ